MRIASIHLYPVKACRGVSVRSASVEGRGLGLDRRWMVVDPEGGFLTQRTVPALGRIGVTIDGDHLIAETPGMGGHRFPAHLTEGPRRPVRVWRDTVDAVEDPGGSEWFSEALGRPCRLVHQPDADGRRAGSHAAPSDPVSLADAYPVLVLSQASVDDLSRRVGRSLSMQRFRPNLVIADASPYAEDDWGRVRMGAVAFRGVKRCDRCVVTTLDPETLEGGPEPLRTLASYRRWDGKVWLGMNLVPEGRGILHAGDPVVPSAPFSG